MPEAAREWDVIIVGSGIGGATLAHALTLRGLDVLMLEKGARIPVAPDQGEPTEPAARLARGWWPMPVSPDAAGGPRGSFFAPLGCAVGGSSIHYAAALERLAPEDFLPLDAGAPGTPAWPVTYGEFSPYYDLAEALYRAQPASEAQAMLRLSDWDRGFMQNMRRNGLRPGLLRVAMRYDEQCTECIGRICPRGCKADAFSACIEAALQRPNFRLLENCDVQGVDATATRVEGVRAVCAGREVSFRGRAVALCAGAMRSPLILLRSGSAAWPAGLANASGQVGRNLMFHTSDLYAVWAPRRLDRRGRQHKSISIRDFYRVDGDRLGYVQSMGIEIGHGAIAAHLKNIMRRHGIRNDLLLSVLAKVPSRLGGALLGAAGLFAAMTEDDPHPDNRVMPDAAHPDGIRFSYTISPDLRRRADALRKRFSQAIRPWRMAQLEPALTMNYGHPCGTCRSGDDPATSVLDRDCRAHGLDNLFVVDSSFMPRSGAVNPALTIAANALRVASKVAAVAAAEG